MPNNPNFFFLKTRVPKRGKGGGGPTFGKNSQKIPFFVLDVAPYISGLWSFTGKLFRKFSGWLWYATHMSQTKPWGDFMHWSQITASIYDLLHGGRSCGKLDRALDVMYLFCSPLSPGSPGSSSSPPDSHVFHMMDSNLCVLRTF